MNRAKKVRAIREAVPTYEEHASSSRRSARAAGLADCVHFAPDWKRRADTLYDVLAGLGDWPETVGLLQDGRMVAMGVRSSVFEKSGGDLRLTLA